MEDTIKSIVPQASEQQIAEADKLLLLIEKTITINELDKSKPRPIYDNWTIILSSGIKDYDKEFVFAWKVSHVYVAQLLWFYFTARGMNSEDKGNEVIIVSHVTFHYRR
jgi:hypothetical protein